MNISLELEDTFADIVRKASRGTATPSERLAAAAGIPIQRLQSLGAEAANPTEAESRAIASALALDPAKLSDIALHRWQPPPLELADHLGHQINAPHPSNGYFVILKDAGVAAFVDPGGNARNIVSTLQRAAVELRYVLLTHKHYDHVDSLGEVRAAFPKASVVVHELDAAAIGPAAAGATLVQDGGALPFGGDDIYVLHTPGHTDGSCCFLFKGGVFTGDTLFAGSVGGVFGDRFGYRDILAGVRTKLFALPDETVVLAGHGPPSTIAGERAHNPFFAA
ncbi:MAG: MBL fold metallo-hydrolase [Candidatus Eremiobacteraeota bacterium]|nr:MBL fold metallo-hydrolase [Candidatus Eremiobacteraeota bacterium]